MPRTHFRLAATLLASVVLLLTLTLSGQSAPPDISLAARLGAELGALASAGAGAAPGTSARAAQAAADAGVAPRTSAREARAAASPAPTATPQPPAPTPAPTEVTPKGKLVFIDPGHGGPEPGAAHRAADGTEDLIEKEANLSIGLKLAEMLRQEGYDVAMSRTADQYLVPGAWLGSELQARVDLANETGADLYICIHNNGSESPGQRGTEVWYCGDRPFASESIRLAAAVQEALVRNVRDAGYNTHDRGIKDEGKMGHFAVLGPHVERPSRMPGILGESLFLSNEEDAAALKRDDIRTAIARGYLEGIKAYFGDGQ